MPKKILVGVLDWGLGHATRCVPLIDYLLQLECQIFIAASGPQKKILQEAFPALQFLEPPPYAIAYPGNGKSMQTAIIRQLPRLYKVISAEERWLELELRKHGFDLIISDNRYGFRHGSVHSVFITHQLSPRSGFGKLADFFVRKVHYHFIRVFDECWVPDIEAGGGLAGELSHPHNLPPNTTFIGPMSRLEGPDAAGDHNGAILLLISGPEPARTQFEVMLRSQLKDYKGHYIMVRGLPGSPDQGNPGELNHVDAAALARLMAESSLIICRSGYTTIMDLLKMGKKAFLVPTPGQTEQEYLAEYLENKGIFPFAKQSRFSLTDAMAKARSYPYQVPELDFEAYKKDVENLINR